ESPGAADAMGIDVARYRYAHVLAGGALAGIGGACYSLAITPGWTSGDCLVGAYFFGGLSGGLPSALQAHGYTIAPEFLNALPYVMTIVVLVLVSAGFARRRIGAPAALGVPYVREER